MALGVIVATVYLVAIGLTVLGSLSASLTVKKKKKKKNNTWTKGGAAAAAAVGLGISRRIGHRGASSAPSCSSRWRRRWMTSRRSRDLLRADPVGARARGGGPPAPFGTRSTVLRRRGRRQGPECAPRRSQRRQEDGRRTPASPRRCASSACWHNQAAACGRFTRTVRRASRLEGNVALPLPAASHRGQVGKSGNRRERRDPEAAARVASLTGDFRSNCDDPTSGTIAHNVEPLVGGLTRPTWAKRERSLPAGPRSMHAPLHQDDRAFFERPVAATMLPLGSAGRGDGAPRPVRRSFQHRPGGSQFTKPALHRRSPRGRREDLDGRQGAMDGQRVHRAPLAVAEVECVYLHAFETGSEARAGIVQVDGLLQRRAAPFGPRRTNTPSKPMPATRGSDWRRNGNRVKRSSAAKLSRKRATTSTCLDSSDHS